MSSHLDTVAATLRALMIPTLTTGTWFGRPAIRLAPAVRRVIAPELVAPAVEYLLDQHLYTHLYTTGGPVPHVEASGAPRQAVRTPFVDRLSLANTGVGRWEPGWELTHIEDESVVIRSGGISVIANTGMLRAPAGGQRVGDAVRLHRPKEFTGLSPGFYVAVGDAPGPAAEAQLVRWYWNLVPGGAEPLIRELTGRLNAAGTAFRLKVLTHPESYRRCDAGVLYGARADVSDVAAVVSEVLPLLRAHLKDGVPAFTKRLTPGLGLAEDPGDGESFGQHRCRLLAGGIMLARARGERTHSARLRTVLGHLAEHGVDIAAPYLNAESVDDYALPARPRRARRAEPGNSDRIVRPGLDVAVTVGTRLSRRAVIHGDECTWLAPVRGDDHGSGTASGPVEHTHRPVGAALYDGAAGIAWYLGELHAVGGDPAHRRVAMGGIRHALRLTEDAGPTGPAGLFDGAAGVALASARLGAILGEDELLARARRMAHNLCRQREEQCPDLLSGTAGIVLGLLTLDALLDDRALTERAHGLGEELLRNAETGPEGTSWRWRPEQCHRNLTGYSHGTAGIAHALLELYRRSGDRRFRDAADGARAYDRSAFDAVAANWADHRRPASRHRRYALRPGTAWCHGAPGILVARLRACGITGDEEDRADAVVALTATRAALDDALAVASPEFGLCHGLAGVVEIVHHCERMAGPLDGRNGGYDEVEDGLARFASDSGGSDDPPGLMTGLAGIGSFFLRRAHPTVPSPLFVDPAAGWAGPATGAEMRLGLRGSVDGDAAAGDHLVPVVAP